MISSNPPEDHSQRVIGASSRFNQQVALLVVAAAALRCCNLGTFSLWLDEILLVLRSRGTLAETWAACYALGEHPPLSGLVMSLLYRLGASDDAQRLIPITLGLGSIVLLVVWTRAHFGATPAIVGGWLAALSPFHIRYSQELRPYAYVLFFALLALVLADRVMRDPAPLRIILCGIAVAGGMYSHNLFVLAATPILADVIVRARSARFMRGVLSLGVSAAIGLLLYLPWLGRLLDLAGEAHEASAQTWVWRFFTRRWEFLTVAGREGNDLSWGGVMMLVLVAAGLAVAVRRWRRGGLAVAMGAVVGVAGVEVFYHFVIERWSVGRYDIIGWPFLVIAAALGVDVLLRRKALLLGVPVLLALGIAHVMGISEYQVKGREQWHRMAEVVRSVRRPGEPVLTENIFCQYGIAYYLCGADALREVLPPNGPVALNRDLGRLREHWPAGHSCLLVRGGTPQSPEVRRLASHFPLLATYSESSWLYRLPGQSQITWSDTGQVRFTMRQGLAPWPAPSLTLVPEPLRDPRQTCVGRVLDLFSTGSKVPRDEPRRLDFDARSTAHALNFGWSGFETTPKGTTFVWATGRESSILFETSGTRPLTLRLDVWPFPVPGRSQHIRGFVNGHLLGEAQLEGGSQSLEVGVPAATLRPGPNLLVLQFAYAIAPAEINSESHDWRPLACAFDCVEFRFDEG